MTLITSDRDLQKQTKTSQFNPLQAYYEIEEDVIHKWEPESEVYALKYGKFFIVSLSTIPAWQCLSKGRTLLKMRHHGYRYLYPMMVSGVLGSAIFTVLTQTFMVKKDILLAETPCSVCVSSRAGAMQVTTGVLLPSFLATTNFALIAKSQGYIKGRNYKGFGTNLILKWTFKHLYQCRSILAFNALLQLGASYLYVTKMYSEWFHVNDVLENAIKRENDLKSQKENSQDYLF